MDINKVISSGAVGQARKLANNTVLGVLQKHHDANFTLRRKFSIEFYGAYKNMWEKQRTALTFLSATKTESRVMREFLRNIGAIDFNIFDSEYEVEFCSQMLPLWMLLEVIFTTRAHGGHTTRKLFYVDDSYLEHNEDCLLKFYYSHKDIYNPISLARCCMLTYKKYFEVIEFIQRLSIDESERMALTAICIYRRAILINGSTPKLQEMLNMLFKDLKNYYDSTFNSVSMRFGQLILCVEAVEAAHVEMVKQLTIVSLNLKNPSYYGQNCYSVSYFK